MRLFLILFTDCLPELVSVAEALTRAGHAIPYWVSADFVAEGTVRFPKTVFHNHFDALLGKPAPRVDTAGFAPPGAALLAELSETESALLMMMNKLFGRLSVAERKRLYYEMVRYWEGVLELHRPDAILFPLVPHEVYDFVLYALAKRRGIRTLMFTATQDFVRLMPMEDYTDGVRVLREECARLGGRKVSLEELSPDIRSYINKHSLRLEDPTPPNMRNLKEKYQTPRRTVAWRAITDATLPWKIARYLKKFFGANPLREYRAVMSPPDFKEKFVYVPLQYQPEATTSPLAGVFADQVLLVETVAAALPEGWRIYVKEHPRQFVFSGLNFSQYRFRGYYTKLARIPNVRVVPAETNTFSLIAASQAVALATGTAGLEALLRGKPALVFGYAWYRDCPGVFRVRDAASCREAFDAIRRSSAPSRDDLIRYFACVDKVSIRGYIEPHTKRLANVREEENAANLTKAVLAQLS